MNKLVSPRRGPRKARGSIFHRRQKHSIKIDDAPELSESSESSFEITSLEEAGQDEVGELSFGSIVERPTAGGLSTTTTSISQQDSNADNIKNLILMYKSRPKPLSDTPAPSKPHRQTSFKMEGVPACINKQIEKNARRDAERRRKRQTAKSKAVNAELHDSLSALSMLSDPDEERSSPFLDLPNEHPLFWTHAELDEADFEMDRAFLSKLLKNPQQTVHGKRLSTRVELALRKMQLFEWDAAILNRCANELFHPELNPLNLSPTVTQYFYSRFMSLKTKLMKGREVVYGDKTYNIGDNSELFERLRGDFEDATQN